MKHKLQVLVLLLHQGVNVWPLKLSAAGCRLHVSHQYNQGFRAIKVEQGDLKPALVS